jgi:hypothetical protein
MRKSKLGTRACILHRQKKRLRCKRSQEEMLGFALIVVLVAVAMIIFIGFMVTRPQKEPVESYEVESFIQSALKFTTDCEDNLERQNVRKLILSCKGGENCVDSRATCDVLNGVLKGIVEESWKIEGRPEKGYEVNISVGERKLVSFKEGNKTNNYKQASQALASGGENIEVSFRAYY